MSHAPARPPSPLRSRLAWSASHLLATRGLALLTRLALARLLAPEHFGLFGLVAVALGLLTAVADFGLQGALVQRRGAGKHGLASSVCWALAASGAVLWAAAALAGAPALAAFHGDARLLAPAQALGALLFFQSLTVVPTALLMRQGRFKALVIAEFAGVALGAAAALLLAQAGYGVWGLVAQQLLGAALTALLVWQVVHWRPECRVRAAALQSLWPFGRAMAGTRLVMYLRQNLDQLFIGAVLGAAPLGVYMIAFTFTEGLRTQVASAAARVMLPLYSQQQGNPEALRRHYLRATRVMILALAPMSLAALLYADAFCLHVLGPAWKDAATPMRILAVGGLLHVASGPAAEVLQGMGRPQELLRMAWRNVLLFALPCTALLTWWQGTVGAAMAFTLTVATQRVALHRALRAAIGLDARAVWHASGAPLALAAGTCMAAYALRGTLPLPLEAALLALGWLVAGLKLARR